MKRWEYYTVRTNEGQMNDYLRSCGAGGWELVSAVPEMSPITGAIEFFWLFFKRERAT